LFVSVQNVNIVCVLESVGPWIHGYIKVPGKWRLVGGLTNWGK